LGSSIGCAYSKLLALRLRIAFQHRIKKLSAAFHFYLFFSFCVASMSLKKHVGSIDNEA
jgi:hypothetical protein